MVAYALQQRALVAAGWGKLDECLEQLVEERVATEPTRVQVRIHFRDVPGPPQVHQPVDLVYQRDRPAPWPLVAEGGALPLLPGLQLDLAAGALFGLAFVLGSLPLFVLWLLSAGPEQDVALVGKERVREAT